MAKRYSDTELWDEDWFIRLPQKMKLAWNYLCAKCDCAGVWRANFIPLHQAAGEEVTKQDLEEFFGKRIVWLSETRLWIRGFISFQYGELKPSVSAHRGVMKRVYQAGSDLPLDADLLDLIRRFEMVVPEKSKGYEERGSEPLPIPLPGVPNPSVPLKDKDKDKEEDKDKGSRTKTNAALEIPHIAACKQTWLETLKHFGQPRERILRDEEVIIARAVQDNGAETVDLALYGARHEPSGDNWNPRDHVDLARVLTKDKEGKPRIQKFVGYGIKAREKEKQLAATRVQIEQARQVHGEEEEAPHADPERVRAMIRNIGRASSMPAGGFV